VTSALQLPAPVGSASGWQLADYVNMAYVSGPADSTGVATATGRQLDQDELWLIDHMVCFCESGGTTLRLYSGQVGPGFLLDGSDAGSFNVADWPNGLQLQPTRQLVAVWSGCTVGARGTITLQGRSLRRVGG
jgi:hypothetical protein